jgi:hypothetical protein
MKANQLKKYAFDIIKRHFPEQDLEAEPSTSIAEWLIAAYRSEQGCPFSVALTFLVHLDKACQYLKDHPLEKEINPHYFRGEEVEYVEGENQEFPIYAYYPEGNEEKFQERRIVSDEALCLPAPFIALVSSFILAEKVCNDIAVWSADYPLTVKQAGGAKKGIPRQYLNQWEAARLQALKFDLEFAADEVIAVFESLGDAACEGFMADEVLPENREAGSVLNVAAVHFKKAALAKAGLSLPGDKPAAADCADGDATATAPDKSQSDKPSVTDYLLQHCSLGALKCYLTLPAAVRAPFNAFIEETIAAQKEVSWAHPLPTYLANLMNQYQQELKQILTYRLSSDELKQLLGYRLSSDELKQLLGYRLSSDELKQLLGYRLSSDELKQLLGYQLSSPELRQLFPPRFTAPDLKKLLSFNLTEVQMKNFCSLSAEAAKALLYSFQVEALKSVLSKFPANCINDIFKPPEFTRHMQRTTRTETLASFECRLAGKQSQPHQDKPKLNAALSLFNLALCALKKENESTSNPFNAALIAALQQYRDHLAVHYVKDTKTDDGAKIKRLTLQAQAAKTLVDALLTSDYTAEQKLKDISKFVAAIKSSPSDSKIVGKFATVVAITACCFVLGAMLGSGIGLGVFATAGSTAAVMAALSGLIKTTFAGHFLLMPLLGAGVGGGAGASLSGAASSYAFFRPKPADQQIDNIARKAAPVAVQAQRG